MKLLTIVVGALSTNCYVIVPDGSADCLLIDPGAQAERLTQELTSRGLTPRYLLSTHGHADHTGGVAGVIGAMGGVFAISALDAPLAADPPAWLTSHLTDFQVPPEPGLLLNGGEHLEVAGLIVQVIATPGHTPGSLCYRIGDTVFTGDTLFKGSIGRYDLPGGDGDTELASIREKLLILGDALRVLPGHGLASTIGQERRTNPYLAPRAHHERSHET